MRTWPTSFSISAYSRHSRLLLRLIPIAAIVLTCACHASAKSDSVPSDAIAYEVVGPSSQFAKFSLPGPRQVTVLKADLATTDLRLRAVASKNQLGAGEPMNTASRRLADAGENVIGVINGDFWSNTPRLYSPIGLFVVNDYLASAPGVRSAMAILDDGRVIMDQFTLRVTATPRGRTPVIIESVNELSSANSTALFTPVLREAIVGTTATHILLALKAPRLRPNEPAEATVIACTTGQKTTLVPGQIALSLPPRRAADFTIGTAVTIEAKVPEAPGVITEAVGGGPRLLRDGQVAIGTRNEGTGKSFATTRHPRTAVGVGGPGNRTVFLVVVDGRQPDLSIGAGLEDLALLMKKLGARDAINLDGGGSSTMVVRGEVKNAPSDARGPRPVCNGIALLACTPPGPAARLQFAKDQTTLRPGDLVRVPAKSELLVAMRGFDTNDNPVPLPAKSRIVTVHSEDITAMATADDRIRIRAGATPSVTSVTVMIGGLIAQTAVQVFAPDSLEVRPRRLDLSSGETGALQVTAITGTKRELLSAESVSLEIPLPALVSANGLTLTSGNAAGKTRATVRVGDAKIEVPVTVDAFRREMLESFDTAPQPATGTNHIAEETSSRSTAERLAGAAATELRYAMRKSGGRSRIDVPLSATLTQAPERLSLAIFGDGSENWIRADLLDALGNKYLIDFTASTRGIIWKNEWRRVVYDMNKLIVMGEETPPTPTYPATITAISIVQDQEKLKGRGVVRYDDLEALFPPE